MEPMSYLAIVERVNQSWNAYVPDLPGCVAVDMGFELTIAAKRDPTEGS